MKRAALLPPLAVFTFFTLRLFFSGLVLCVVCHFVLFLLGGSCMPGVETCLNPSGGGFSHYFFQTSSLLFFFFFIFISLLSGILFT